MLDVGAGLTLGFAHDESAAEMITNVLRVATGE
jgi:hypothetical protein